LSGSVTYPSRLIDVKVPPSEIDWPWISLTTGASLTAVMVIVSVSDALWFVPPPLSLSVTVTRDDPKALTAGVYVSVPSVDMEG